MNTLGNTAIEGNIRLIGNRVLLAPKERPAKIGRIFLPADNELNTFKQEWLVLAVGPGAYKVNKKTKVRTFVPLTDVVPGDMVLCRLDMPRMSQSLDDGTGRVIVDASQLQASWREEPQTPAAAFGGDEP